MNTFLHVYICLGAALGCGLLAITALLLIVAVAIVLWQAFLEAVGTAYYGKLTRKDEKRRTGGNS